MTDTEAYYAHISACVICIYTQERSGSGMCIEGFRRSLRWGAEVVKKVRSIQYVDSPKQDDLVEYDGAYWRVEKREWENETGKGYQYDLVWVHGDCLPSTTIRAGIHPAKMRVLNAMETLAVASS